MILLQVLQYGFLAFCFTFITHNATAHKSTNAVTKAQKRCHQGPHRPLSSTEPIPVRRDFDQLRVFQSYDPATDTWTKIEDFEAVDILEDAAEQREDRYIYYSFWAYDAAKNCWHKVDIRDHGYRLGGIAAIESTEHAETAPHKSSSFWKTLAFGCSLGTGPTFYHNKITRCRITERDGIFFLQTAPEAQNKEGYRMNWFGAGYQKTDDLRNGSPGDVSIQDAGGEIVFKGVGWNIPITLLTHYTFFKRCRLGAGCTFEINHLRKLAPKKGATVLGPFTVQQEHAWFYHMGWFGMAGLKIIHEPHQDVIVDVRIGQNYNAGATPRHLLGKKRYVDQGWLLGVGVAYEHRLNSYFRLLLRLAGDWKRHNGTPPDIHASPPLVKLHPVAVHLDLGVHVSFGKDIEDGTQYRENGS